MEHAVWTEKYRPQKFSEIKGQDAIIEKVKAFVEQKNLPHLIFAGPAGIGKTTTALIIAKVLFGKEWRTNFLELNASDARGIDVIRTKVKDFARTRAIGDVPFKIIFLDECDALTKEAQQALRRTMENYTATTRFILSCNFISKLIDPIQSRCAVFKFKPLQKRDMFSIIDKIARSEDLKLDKAVKEALFEVSGGDCRRLENVLQSAAAITKNIKEDLVYDMAAMAKPKEIHEILIAALKANFIKAKTKLLKTMLNYGLSGLDTIKQIQQEVVKLDINDEDKLKIIEMCAEVEFRMVEGSDEFVQLEALLAKIGTYKK